MEQIVTGILIPLIEGMLPLLGTSTATEAWIEQIITALENVLPLLGNFVPTVYQAIKNIIVALKADPNTTQAQWTKIDAIDAQLDAANDAAIAAVDPDAPTTAGNGTTAT